MMDKRSKRDWEPDVLPSGLGELLPEVRGRKYTIHPGRLYNN